MSFSFPVAAAVKSRLEKLGLHSDEDLALHLPLRWEDQTRLTAIRDLKPGVPAVVQAKVVSAEVMYRPRRQLVATVSDASGELVIRFLTFYPSQVQALQPGRLFRIAGESRGGFFGAEMVHPRCQSIQPDTPLPDSLTPVYPTTAGLGQASLGKLIEKALAKLELEETLPDEAYAGLGFPGYAEAIRLLHHPGPELSLAQLESREHPAFRRLAFDELLAQQFSLRLARQARAEKRARPFKTEGSLTQALRSALPFALTPAQEKVWQEISRDLGETRPMRRLLQGDVGSGKTVVAALAMLQAVEAGHQAALRSALRWLPDTQAQRTPSADKGVANLR